MLIKTKPDRNKARCYLLERFMFDAERMSL